MKRSTVSIILFMQPQWLVISISWATKEMSDWSRRLNLNCSGLHVPAKPQSHKKPRCNTAGLVWERLGDWPRVWPVADLRHLCGFVWTCVDLCGFVWTCVDLCGLVWTCVDLCGLVREGVGGLVIDHESDQPLTCATCATTPAESRPPWEIQRQRNQRRVNSTALIIKETMVLSYLRIFVRGNLKPAALPTII